MKTVIAIDSFKGSISSSQAGNAAAEGIKRVYPDAEITVRPLADGGEGTCEALVSGLNGTDAFFPVIRNVVTLEEAMNKDNAKANLADTVEQVFRVIKAVR